MQVTENVFVDTGFRGSNVGYVTTSDGVVMIDSPELPRQALSWRAEIAGKGKPIYLINTEYHPEHVAGNFFFDTVTIAHERTASAMSRLDPQQLKPHLIEMDPTGEPLLGDYFVRLPRITFSQHLTLQLGGLTFKIFHLPGHTLGQTAVLVPEERVVFTGDNVVFRRQAFLYDADPDTWLDSLGILMNLDVDYVVTGRGEVCGRADLPEMAQFISDWVASVENAKRRGLSREDASETISFLDRYPSAIDQEKSGQEVQKLNVVHLWDIVD